LEINRNIQVLKEISKIFNNNLNHHRNYLKLKIQQEMPTNIKILIKEHRCNHILILMNQRTLPHSFKNLTTNIRKWFDTHKILGKVEWNI
jgi:hypothetical protein